MRAIAAIAFLVWTPLSVAGADTAESESAQAPVTFLTETGCGSCSYSMPGVRGCVTAVKIDDQAYLVEGVETNAHADGLCDSTKLARIAGKVEKGKFIATHYEIDESASAGDVDSTTQAELGCASCTYGKEGIRGCKTAVKIGEESYLLKGVDIDAHSTGLCTAAKPAKVAGKVQDGEYIASIVVPQPAQN